MTQNIFVVGLDDFHRRQLETVRGAAGYSFHGLVPYREIVNPQRYPMSRLLGEAEHQLDAFPDRVDAIIGHWDFPTTCMLPLLRAREGLDGPSLESMLVCEHKYWSRLVQQEVIPGCIPAFQGVDPFGDDPIGAIGLDYPFWLKPAVAFSSYLGFRIEGEADLRHALERIRAGIGKFAEPFSYLLERTESPGAFPAGGGALCVAESIIGGELCTLEGFVFRGGVRVYGVVDSIRGPNQVSFMRYQYPSRLPTAVQERMIGCAARVVPALGIDNTPFNMEFFWKPERDEVMLLEVNPRISKSHCPIFALAAGASHHEVAIDVALGRRPRFPHRAGDFPMAAKFMPRTYRDAVVTRVPDQADFDAVRRRFPEALFINHVREGMALHDLPNQDSYSFELADVFLGGEDEADLRERFQGTMGLLDYRFSEEVPTNYG